MGINDQSSKALEVIQKSWTRAHSAQSGRNTIYTRLWQRYKSYNPNVTDPYRSNLVTPKLYSIVETIAPKLGKALFGKRPYVPIKSQSSPEEAQAIEDALDAYLYKDHFRIKAIQALKAMTLFGTMFIEPYPDQEIVTVKQQVDQQTYPWGQEEQSQDVPRFRLRTRLWAPWQVYVEPRMLNVNDDGFIITIEIISKTALKKVQRFAQIDMNKIADSALSEAEKKFSDTMMQAIGITIPGSEDDFGVLLRYMTNDRLSYCWNGIDILEDRDNPFDPKYQSKNICRFACNLDPMLQNSFWGQAEGKNIEPILDKLDETWNMTFDNHDQINQAVIAFKEGAVNAEQCVMVAGVRIPVKQSFSGTVQDAIQRIQTMGLPADHYRIPEVLERQVDLSVGVWDANRGETPDTQQTATLSSLLATAGDMRNELRVAVIESLGMEDFADKATRHIDMFSSLDDKMDVVGPRAMLLSTMNPHSLPGGFDYEFAGSDAIINDFQKRQDWEQVTGIIKDDQSMKPGAVAKKTMKVHGLSDDEIAEMQYTPEEINQMLAIAAKQQASQQGGPGNETRTKSENGVPVMGQQGE